MREGLEEAAHGDLGGATVATRFAAPHGAEPVETELALVLMRSSSRSIVSCRDSQML